MFGLSQTDKINRPSNRIAVCVCVYTRGRLILVAWLHIRSCLFIVWDIVIFFVFFYQLTNVLVCVRAWLTNTYTQAVAVAVTITYTTTKTKMIVHNTHPHIHAHKRSNTHAYHLFLMLIQRWWWWWLLILFLCDGSLVHPLVFGISLTCTVHAHWIVLSLSLALAFILFLFCFQLTLFGIIVCCFHTLHKYTRQDNSEENVWVYVCVSFRTLRKTNERLCGFHTQPVDIYASVRLRVILLLLFCFDLVLCYYFFLLSIHHLCCVRLLLYCCYFIFYIKICFTFKNKNTDIYTQKKKKKKKNQSV